MAKRKRTNEEPVEPDNGLHITDAQQNGGSELKRLAPLMPGEMALSQSDSTLAPSFIPSELPDILTPDEFQSLVAMVISATTAQALNPDFGEEIVDAISAHYIRRNEDAIHPAQCVLRNADAILAAQYLKDNKSIDYLYIARGNVTTDNFVSIINNLKFSTTIRQLEIINADNRTYELGEVVMPVLVSALQDNKSLKSLSIEPNAEEALEIIQALKGTSITELTFTFSNTKVTNKLLEALFYSHVVTNLKLNQCKVSLEESVSLTQALKSNKTLKEFTLSGDGEGLPKENFYLVDFLLRQSKSLRKLSFDECGIEASDDKLVGNLSISLGKNKYLTTLNIEGEYVNKTEIACLAVMLKSNKFLTSFHFGGCHVYDSDLEKNSVELIKEFAGRNVAHLNKLMGYLKEKFATLTPPKFKPGLAEYYMAGALKFYQYVDKEKLLANLGEQTVKNIGTYIVCNFFKLLGVSKGSNLYSKLPLDVQCNIHEFLEPDSLANEPFYNVRVLPMLFHSRNGSSVELMGNSDSGDEEAGSEVDEFA